MQANDGYTDRAATATLETAGNEQDFGGWLAGILARAAAELGSTAALTAVPASRSGTSVVWKGRATPRARSSGWMRSPPAAHATAHLTGIRARRI